MGRSDSADSLDHASEVEEEFREAALQQMKHAMRPPKDFDGKTCTDCGEDVVQGRLALGLWRCLECQQKIERNSKLYR